MKPGKYQRYRNKEMMQDALILLGPPILTLMGILWFFRGDWIHTHVATVLMSFVDSFLALLRRMV